MASLYVLKYLCTVWDKSNNSNADIENDKVFFSLKIAAKQS